MQNTPIFEDNGPENFKGIDIMRTCSQLSSMPPLRCSYVCRGRQGDRSKNLTHVRRGGTRIMAASAEQPMTAPRRGEFRAQSEHVEKLAAKLDQAGDPEVRAAALELVAVCR